MSCPPRTPVFWQRQPRLPVPVLRFLKVRMEAALAGPEGLAHLVWPTLLGAPRMRAEHPGGLPEPLLLAQAGPMLAPFPAGAAEASRRFRETLERFPDTAERGPDGWLPQRVWDPLSALVSLRSGVALLALMGLPGDARYPLAAGTALFNAALFYECHDALEPLWTGAEGPLRDALQGLIMLASGFHHHQLQNAPGMVGLWEDALPVLARAGEELATPWGGLRFGPAARAAAARLEAVGDGHGGRLAEPPWERLWELERPEWELT